MSLEDVVTLIKQGICIYTFSLIILGTVGNIITITICLRKRLRQINTFKFFAFNAFLDTIGLYGWNVRQFVYYLFYEDLSLKSLVYCDLSSFFQYVSFEASAWFLVIIGFDRLLTLKIAKWSKVYFKGTRVYLFGFGVIGFFCGLNAYFASQNGYIKQVQNSTETQVVCYQSSETDSTILDVWSWMFLVLYTVLPFILLTLCNILLIMTVVNSKKSFAKKGGKATVADKKQIKMAMTIIIISLLFCLFTLPTASIQGSTLVYLLGFNFGQLVVAFCNMFAYTYQSINFIMLTATNSQFEQELKVVFGIKPKVKRAKNVSSN